MASNSRDRNLSRTDAANNVFRWISSSPASSASLDEADCTVVCGRSQSVAKKFSQASTSLVTKIEVVGQSDAPSNQHHAPAASFPVLSFPISISAILHFASLSAALLLRSISMLSTARFLALVAVVCSAVALNGATVSASGLENDPYTLPDGTVVDPTNEDRSIVDEAEHTADPNQTLGESNVRGWGRQLRA
ncbi:hypothetical protein FI667_g9392, partial [Globisporangium splendens]